MRQKNRLEFIAALLFVVLGTMVIAVTDADLILASYFHKAGHWPVGEYFPLKALYRIEGYPAYALALAGLCAAGRGALKQRSAWIRQGGFLVLLLALGPGLLVNGIFKKSWGRPRPCQVREFGGNREFHQPWQPDFHDDQARSFPSGHSSAAFYLSAPFFLYRRTNPALAKKWLLGGVAFGLMMGFSRIAQGGHFISDILWAWGMVHLSALILSAHVLSYGGRDAHSSNPVIMHMKTEHGAGNRTAAGV